MQEFLDRFGLTEALAYLAPGVIVLLSIPLWIQPDLGGVLGPALADQQFVVAVVLFVASYALGFIIAWWSEAGAAGYFLRQAHSSRRAPVFWFLWLFHSLPLPTVDIAMVEQRLRFAERLAKLGVHGLSRVPQTPWGELAAFRTLMSGRIHDFDRGVLAEANVVHTRLQFALGVGLAVLLVALQCFARVLVRMPPEMGLDWGAIASFDGQLQDISTSFLLAVAILGLAVSFGLRRVAGQWLDYEMFLTNSLERGIG